MGGTELFIASALMSGLSTAAGISQAQQQKKAQSQAAAIQAQQAQNDINALEVQKTQAEQDRRDRLERTTAAQRAAFAASGVSGDGSADAVFGNLLTEANKERDSYNANIDRQIQGLQSGIQLNLLSRPGPNYLGALADFGSSLVSDAGRYKPDFLNPPKPPKPPAGGES